MNKKIKRLAITTIICVIVASIFGSVMVLAPPELIFPQLMDVFVTNTGADPIPVEVTDETLNVNLDEPINVTLDEPIDVTLDEPIEVTNPSGDSLDVAIPDGVEITNTDSLDVEVTNSLDANVSGWLHTTQSGHKEWNTFVAGANQGGLFINTEGYREITVVFDSSNDNVVFGVAWDLDNKFRWAEGWTFGSEKPTAYTTPFGTTPRYFFKTYSVRGELCEIYWHAAAGLLASGDLVSIAYYMTT